MDPVRLKIQQQKEKMMLASDKIAAAFKAICEEAEKLQKAGLGEQAEAGLKTIVSCMKQ